MATLCHCRRRLPTSGLISGFTTVPDRVSEFYFLVADNGDLIKCTPTKSALLKRIPNLRDASVTYLARDALDGESVDVLLARSDVSNWQLLLVTADSVQEIDVVDALSPVCHAVAWPAADARVSDGGLQRSPPVVMAANNKLVQVSELVPFIVDSSSQEVRRASRSTDHARFDCTVFQHRDSTARLQDNELVDVSQQINWDLTQPTLAIHAYDSLVAHITSGSICTYAAPASDTSTDSPTWSLPINCAESWSPPPGAWIVCAAACKDTIAVATCSDAGQSTIALLSMHALGQGPTWTSVVFPETPTCLCLVAAGAAVWVGTLEEQLLHYVPVDMTDVHWTVRLPDQCVPNAVVAFGSGYWLARGRAGWSSSSPSRTACRPWRRPWKWVLGPCVWWPWVIRNRFPLL
ncbi:hypothetical protein BCR44DRAFT_1103209 [Catenaria anguillulae PL171]|uniref:Uncharacterized protein n=1 Tax=Catenaria anguillulae PL171 TaxID=765915 RepID=A0A1Y2I253_9FUNG|nr:hypothetical protein BCR44DRAFT_1103209 [Catenaria anguillulae PL171]